MPPRRVPTDEEIRDALSEQELQTLRQTSLSATGPDDERTTQGRFADLCCAAIANKKSKPGSNRNVPEASDGNGPAAKEPAVDEVKHQQPEPQAVGTVPETELASNEEVSVLDEGRYFRQTVNDRVYDVDWTNEKPYEQIFSEIPRAVLWDGRKRVGFVDPGVMIAKCKDIRSDMHLAMHVVNHMKQTIQDVYPSSMHERLPLFQKIELLAKENVNRHAIATMQILVEIRDNYFFNARNQTFHDAKTTKEKFLDSYHFVLCALQEFFVRNDLKGRRADALRRTRFLEDENKKLKNESKELKNENEELKNEIKELKNEIARLQAEIARLQDFDQTRNRAQTNYRNFYESRGRGDSAFASPAGRGRGHQNPSRTPRSGKSNKKRKGGGSTGSYKRSRDSE